MQRPKLDTSEKTYQQTFKCLYYAKFILKPGDLIDLYHYKQYEIIA